MEQEKKCMVSVHVHVQVASPETTLKHCQLTLEKVACLYTGYRVIEECGSQVAGTGGEV